MKKLFFFVRTENHCYGYSGDSLYEALQNAQLVRPSLQDMQASYIEDAFCDEENIAQKAADGLKFAKEIFDDERLSVLDQTWTDFQVLVTDASEWELSSVCDIDGAPRFRWVGEGERPAGSVPSKSLSLKFNSTTGEIRVRS